MPWFRETPRLSLWDGLVGRMGILCSCRCPKCDAEIEPDALVAIDRDESAKIRALNDRLRKSFTGGRVMMTKAVSTLPDDVRARAIELTRRFEGFTSDNDPHQEHDLGSFEIDGQKFLFKLDCYDKSMRDGSENPSDPEKPPASSRSCSPKNTEPVRSSRMPKVLCIYHKDCTDGFGAAWAVRHALGQDNVEFHAASYDVAPAGRGTRRYRRGLQL